MTSVAGPTCRVIPMSPAHVRDVAKLHRHAFREWMSAKIGDGYARAVVSSFQSSPAAVALVAEDNNGKPVGYAFGTSEFASAQDMRSLLLPAALGLLTHP